MSPFSCNSPCDVVRWIGRFRPADVFPPAAQWLLSCVSASAAPALQSSPSSLPLLGAVMHRHPRNRESEQSHVYAMLSMEEIARFVIGTHRVGSRKWMRITIS